MVKILAIGDFHGKIPGKLMSKIKKEKFDLIVSPGDFCGDKELGKLFFKHAYGTEKKLWEFIGKKKFKELEKRNFNSGIDILKKLNSFNVPVIGVKGNWDPVEFGEIGYPERREVKSARKFNKVVSRLENIKLVDFKNYKIEGINFVGYPRSSYPGFINKQRIKTLRKKRKKKVEKIIRRTHLDNKRYYFKLKSLFDKKMINIFIPHNCPYNTKLDKVKQGPQKGKHFGSWLAKKIILDVKPNLVICGHMHECPGVQKIGRSIVVNPGSTLDGRAAFIDYSKEGKIKVRLIH